VILPNSDPAISIELKEGYVCVDSVASFSAVPVDGGSAPLYQWMVNNAPIGAGGTAYSSSTLNDGDRVDCLLTSDAVCAVRSSVLSNIITINLVPDVVAAVDISASANDICHDSLVVFTASPSNGGSHPSYQWMLNGRPAGEGASVYSSADLNNGDVVSAVMTVNERCSSPVGSNVVVMTVYAIPHITLTPDTIIAAGSSITLDPVITGSIVSHQWSPVIGLDDPSLPDPVASPAVNTTYRLDVQNGGGCAASAKEVVVVFYDLVLPNAFTPNGDGHNDLFRIPPSIPVTIQRLSVFDRWGAEVFATANGSEGWDGRMHGRPQPGGTYVWIVEYYNPILKRMMMKKGTVELIR
jgi:gliding motility-associated-like protein